MMNVYIVEILGISELRIGNPNSKKHRIANPMQRNSGEAGKVGSPSKPDDKNNQFLEPTNNQIVELKSSEVLKEYND